MSILVTMPLCTIMITEEPNTSWDTESTHCSCCFCMICDLTYSIITTRLYQVPHSRLLDRYSTSFYCSKSLSRTIPSLIELFYLLLYLLWIYRKEMVNFRPWDVEKTAAPSWVTAMPVTVLHIHMETGCLHSRGNHKVTISNDETEWNFLLQVDFKRCAVYMFSTRDRGVTLFYMLCPEL